MFSIIFLVRILLVFGILVEQRQNLLFFPSSQPLYMLDFAKKYQENLVFNIKRRIRRLTIMVSSREVDEYVPYSWEPGATCELYDEGR